MNTTTEAAGVVEALAVLADALADADNGRVASMYGSTAGINERRLREQQALATLQSRLLAADELREAATEYLDAHIAQATAVVNSQQVELRLVRAELKLDTALAAYDKAGRGKEEAHG